MELPGPPSIDLARWDLAALRRAWLRARPFPHVVIDGALAPAAHAALREAFPREPLWLQEDEIFRFHGGLEGASEPAVAAAVGALTCPAAREAWSALCGRPLSRHTARPYRYERGSYLLPHSDCRPGDARALAFAYYVGAERPLAGGALELFACREEGGRVVEARPARRIQPRDNRLVLFAVSPAALHQVREVTRGARLSLAGWFYP